jgi:2-succinyl-5-enolpyruvyl-6-hydroxy-3-cyclohexene-1-carboxylate synthase
MRHGLDRIVVCPGSRSAPLAVAAALLERQGLLLHTALDERSAAFFALGLGRACGRPAAVITTSGTAVAQLLPAAVEADHGTVPLLLLSADRPARLKGCGANQSVNQEVFLACSCRWVGHGDPAGLGAMGEDELEALAGRAMARACGDGRRHPAGAVHLNLPFEEPLHADAVAIGHLEALLRLPPLPPAAPARQAAIAAATAGVQAGLDPDRPGVVVAGPWRGRPTEWPDHVRALRRWQQRSGWPVLADALSGLRGEPGLDLVVGYDLALAAPGADLAVDQVLRLGPLPASRRLQDWLEARGGRQILISQADPRPLDPLGVLSAQWSGGLASWLAARERSSGPADAGAAHDVTRAWTRAEGRVQGLLERELAEDGEGAVSEPWLARWLSRRLPAGRALMLANSSPVRDWESFAAPDGPARPVIGFRGASGIDGTLSIACGLTQAAGDLVLVSGDLALLHDANGWLWRDQLQGRLTIVLIDNGGGGIFEQLPIRTEPGTALDFERLFAMPQPVDPARLARLHGVPVRRVARREQLAAALAWALPQPLALLTLRSDRRADARLRRSLRTMAAEAMAQR